MARDDTSAGAGEAEEAPQDSELPRDHRSEYPKSEYPKSEKALPDFVRRLLEAGFEKLAERPEQLRQKLGELKLPKETLLALLAQLDDGKSGLYRVISKEIRDFLQSTNFAEDLVRALTTLSFEIKTEVRFIPNDAGGASPRVKSRVQLKTEEADPSEKKEKDAP